MTKKAPIHAQRGDKEWGEDPESWEQRLFGTLIQHNSKVTLTLSSHPLMKERVAIVDANNAYELSKSSCRPLLYDRLLLSLPLNKESRNRYRSIVI